MRAPSERQLSAVTLEQRWMHAVVRSFRFSTLIFGAMNSCVRSPEILTSSVAAESPVAFRPATPTICEVSEEPSMNAIDRRLALGGALCGILGLLIYVGLAIFSGDTPGSTADCLKYVAAQPHAVLGHVLFAAVAALSGPLLF